jgi:hypothetical protein
LEKANVTTTDNKRIFNFVIVGTITHQSRDDALDYLEHLLKKRFVIY